MLKVTNLNAGYVKHHVLFDITLDIKEKDITVIVGPNGSGKSTFLKAIFGLTNIFSGSIFLNSDNIVNLSLECTGVFQLGIIVYFWSFNSFKQYNN